jgi:hypothetical protein
MSRYIDADELWNNRPQIPEGKEGEWVQGFEYCRSIFSKQIKKQIDHYSVDGVEKRILPICAVRKMNIKFEDEAHKQFIKRHLAVGVAEHLIENGIIQYSENTEGDITTMTVKFNIVDERKENGT